MRVFYPKDALYRARYGRTLDQGGEAGPGYFRSEVTGCSKPVYREMSYAEGKRLDGVDGPIITQEMWVRCRRCENCLKARRHLWKQRIAEEIAMSSRTWFGTLTLDPQSQYLASARAMLTSERRGWVWSEMAGSERFAGIVQAINPEITRFLKRVRKNSGASLRYALVSEQHKSGNPHFHLVLHEGQTPVRHKTLKDAWRLGFSDFKLVEEKQGAAWYVAKYLTKAAQGTRLRASGGYGLGPRPVGIACKRDKPSLLTLNTEQAGHCQTCGEPLAVLEFNDYGPTKASERMARSAADPGNQPERLSYEGSGLAAPCKRYSSVSDGEAPDPIVWYCPKGCTTDLDGETFALLAARGASRGSGH